MRVPLITVAVLTLSLGVAAAGPASARAATRAAAVCGTEAPGEEDLNADGCPDAVIGDPVRNAVDVHYPAYDTSAVAGQRVTEQAVTGLPAGADDRFGAASALMHTGADTDPDDLVVAAPGADSGTGAVYVLHGSSDGVVTDHPVRLTGTSAGEHFGATVTATGRDLFVGAPDRAVDGQAAAGAIDHYRIGSDGTVQLIQTLVQGSGGVGGTPEAGDHFGAHLSMSTYGTGFSAAALYGTDDVWLLVGIPDEDVGRVVDAGMVTVVHLPVEAGDARNHKLIGRSTGSVSATQNSAGIGGTAEAGDHFGAAVSMQAEGFGAAKQTLDAAVGVPGEDVGSVRDAGIVQVLRFTATRVTDLANASQNTATVSGTPETGDRFGATVLLQGGGFDPTEPSPPTVDVLVGVPGEDLTGATDAGMLHRLRESGHSLVQVGRALYRGQGVPGAPHSGDELGTGVTSQALAIFAGDVVEYGGSVLLVAVPGDDTGATDAGTVFVLPQSRTGVALQAVGGPRAGDRYGVGANTNDTEYQTSYYAG